MPERFAIPFGEIALHREQLAALESMRLLVTSLGLVVLGELNPLESTDGADPGGPQSVLIDEFAKRVL